MHKGKNVQIRRPVRGLFITLIALAIMAFGSSCTKRRKHAQKKSESPVSKQLASKKASKKPKKKDKPKKTGIKADLDAYMHRVTSCDKTYFSHIDPNSIDDWKTPIPLGDMQSRCDELAVDLDALVQKYMFYGPDVDALLFQASKLVDYYRSFLARSKNISVRNKLPWKKEVGSLKKDLRETSFMMRKKYKAVDWKQAKAIVVDHAYLVILVKKYLKDALKLGLLEGFGQAKKEKVVFLYTLKFEAALLNKLGGQKQSGSKIIKHVQAFALSYKNMIKFFSGNYFDHLEGEGRRLKLDLKKTGIRFNRAIRKIR